LATRPFGQSKYNVRELRIKELTGYAYKFSLLLPLTGNSKLIFSPKEEEELCTLFGKDFGGYTCTRGITHPLLMGGYLDKSGALVRNKHTRFEVYSNQNDLSIRYFKELSNNLVRYSKNVIAERINGYKGEEKILIELVTVNLL